MPTEQDHTAKGRSRPPDLKMTAAEFRALMPKLGFTDPANSTDEGISACGRFFGANPRTAHNWAADGPPAAVALMLRYMQAERLTRADVDKALAKPHQRNRSR